MRSDLVDWFRTVLDADEEATLNDFYTAMRSTNSTTADRCQAALAEIRIKRAVLDKFTADAQWADTLRELNDPTAETYALVAGTVLDVVKILARLYAGRPGWMEEWTA
jgi:hypothetical protein